MNNTNTKSRCKIGEVTYKSAVVIDWTDCTIEDVQALAAQKVVNKFQQTAREANKPVPETITLYARDYRQGLRKPAMTPEQILASMSEDDLIALMKARGLM
ncbi:MAG: hypothetical protein KGI54_07000 [Pseudomonadota bacterium]|nr:hypothetical protein [Pseudomonadota bacterium]